MRRLIGILGPLVALLLAGALPAVASDGDLLGSGAVAPESQDEAAAPVDVAADAGESVVTAGEDVLASTGLDAGGALLLGAGLSGAGVAAIFASRRRARR